MMFKKIIGYISLLSFSVSCFATSTAIPQEIVAQRTVILQTTTREEALAQLDNLNFFAMHAYMKFAMTQNEVIRNQQLNIINFINTNLMSVVTEQVKTFDNQKVIVRAIKKLYQEEKNLNIAKQSLAMLRPQLEKLQIVINQLTLIISNPSLTPEELALQSARLAEAKKIFDAISAEMTKAQNYLNTANNNYLAQKAILDKLVAPADQPALISKIYSEIESSTSLETSAILDGINVTAGIFSEAKKYDYINNMLTTKTRKPFTIVNAWYGLPNDARNVTTEAINRLQKYADKGVLVIPPVSGGYDTFFGKDPIPRGAKQLYIQMQVEGKLFDVTFMQTTETIYAMYKSQDLINYFVIAKPIDLLLQDLKKISDRMTELAQQYSKTTNQDLQNNIISEMQVLFSTKAPAVNTQINALLNSTNNIELMDEENTLLPMSEILTTAKKAYMWAMYELTLRTITYNGTVVKYVYEATVAALTNHINRYWNSWNDADKALWKFRLDNAKLYEPLKLEADRLQNLITTYENRFNTIKTTVINTYKDYTFNSLLSEQSKRILKYREEEAALKTQRDILRKEIEAIEATAENKSLILEKITEFKAIQTQILADQKTITDPFKMMQSFSALIFVSEIIGILNYKLNVILRTEKLAAQEAIRQQIKKMTSQDELNQMLATYRDTLATLTQKKSEETDQEKISSLEEDIIFAKEVISLIRLRIKELIRAFIGSIESIDELKALLPKFQDDLTALNQQKTQEANQEKLVEINEDITFTGEMIDLINKNITLLEYQATGAQNEALKQRIMAVTDPAELLKIIPDIQARIAKLQEQKVGIFAETLTIINNQIAFLNEMITLCNTRYRELSIKIETDAQNAYLAKVAELQDPVELINMQLAIVEELPELQAQQKTLTDAKNAQNTLVNQVALEVFNLHLTFKTKLTVWDGAFDQKFIEGKLIETDATQVTELKDMSARIPLYEIKAERFLQNAYSVWKSKGSRTHYLVRRDVFLRAITTITNKALEQPKATETARQAEINKLVTESQDPVYLIELQLKLNTELTAALEQKKIIEEAQAQEKTLENTIALEVFNLQIPFLQAMVKWDGPIDKKLIEGNLVTNDLKTVSNIDDIKKRINAYQIKSDQYAAWFKQYNNTYYSGRKTFFDNAIKTLITKIAESYKTSELNAIKADIEALTDVNALYAKYDELVQQLKQLEELKSQTTDPAELAIIDTKIAFIKEMLTLIKTKIIAILKAIEQEKQTAINTAITGSQDPVYLIELQVQFNKELTALLEQKTALEKIAAANRTVKNEVDLEIVNMKVTFLQLMVKWDGPIDKKLIEGKLVTTDLETVTTIDAIEKRILAYKIKSDQYATWLSQQTNKTYFNDRKVYFDNAIKALINKILQAYTASELDPIRKEIEALNQLDPLYTKRTEFTNQITELQTLKEQEAAKETPDIIQLALLDLRIAFANEINGIINKKILALLQTQGANEQDLMRQEIESLNDLDSLIAKLAELRDILQGLQDELANTTDPIQKQILEEKIAFIYSMIVEVMKKIFALELEKLKSEIVKLIVDRNLIGLTTKETEIAKRKEEIKSLQVSEPYAPIKTLYGQHYNNLGIQQNLVIKERNMLAAEEALLSEIRSFETRAELEAKLKELESIVSSLYDQIAQSKTPEDLTRQIKFLNTVAIPLIKERIAGFAATEIPQAQKVAQNDLLNKIIRINTVEELQSELTKAQTERAALEEQFKNAPAGNRAALEDQILFLEKIIVLIPSLIQMLQEVTVLKTESSLQSKQADLQTRAGTYLNTTDPFEMAKGNFIYYSLFPLISDMIDKLQSQSKALEDQLAEQQQKQSATLQAIAQMKTKEELQNQLQTLQSELTASTEEAKNITANDQKLLMENQINFLKLTVAFIPKLIAQIDEIESLKTEAELNAKNKELQASAFTLLKDSDPFKQVEGYFIYYALSPLIQEKIIALRNQSVSLQEQLDIQKNDQAAYLQKISELPDKAALEAELQIITETIATTKEELAGAQNNNDKLILQNDLDFFTKVKALITTFIQNIDEITSLSTQDALITKRNNLTTQGTQLFSSKDPFEQTRGIFIFKTLIPLVNTQLTTLAEQNESALELLANQEQTQTQRIKKILQMTTVEQLKEELSLINDELTQAKQALSTTTGDQKTLLENQITFLEYAKQLIEGFIIRLEEINGINTTDVLSDKIQELRTEYQKRTEQFYAASGNTTLQANILDQIDIVKSVYSIANEKLVNLFEQENLMKQDLTTQINQQDALRQQVTQTTDVEKLKMYLSTFTTQHQQLSQEITTADSTKKPLIENQMDFLAHMMQLIPDMIEDVTIIKNITSSTELSAKIKELETAYYAQYQLYQKPGNTLIEQKKILDTINATRTLYTFGGQKLTTLLQQERLIAEQLAQQKKDQEAYRKQIYATNDPNILTTQLGLMEQASQDLEQQLQTIDPSQKPLVDDQLAFTKEMIDVINQKLADIAEQARISGIQNEQEKFAAERNLLEQQFNQSKTKEQLQTLANLLQNRKKELEQLLANTTDPEKKSLISAHLAFINDLLQRINQKMDLIDAQAAASAEDAYKQQLQAQRNEQNIIRQQVQGINSLYELEKQKNLFESQLAALLQQLAKTTDPYQRALLEDQIAFIREMLALINKKRDTLLRRQAMRDEVDRLNTPQELLAKLNELNKTYEQLRAEYYATQDPNRKAELYDELKFIEELYNLINAKLAKIAQYQQLTPEEEAVIKAIENGTYLDLIKEQNEINSMTTKEQLEAKMRELEARINLLNSIKNKVQNPDVINLYIEQIRSLFNLINSKLQQILNQQQQQPVQPGRTPTTPISKPQTSRTVQELQPSAYKQSQVRESSRMVNSNAQPDRQETGPEITVSEDVVRQYAPSDQKIPMYNVTQTAQEQNFLNQLMYIEKYVVDVNSLLSQVRPGTAYSKSLQQRLYVLKQYRAYFIEQILHLRATLPNIVNQYQGPTSTAGYLFSKQK